MPKVNSGITGVNWSQEVSQVTASNKQWRLFTTKNRNKTLS